MRNKANLVNIDKSNPSDYPNGRIKNNTGAGDGTQVNEVVYGDFHEMKDKLMRLYGIVHNGLPDNETNGYQFVEALVALASKNDFVLPLTSSSGKLFLPLKLGKIQENEGFTVISNITKGAESLIRGLDNVDKPVNIIGNFVPGDYLQVIFTSASVIIVKQIGSNNFSQEAISSGFMLAASLVEVIAGTINNKALTPATYLGAFAEYVTGNTSSNFLSTQTQNGLFSKEDKVKLDGLTQPTSNVRNRGSFTGLDARSTSSGALTVSGDILTATKLSSGESRVNCTLANAMDDTNYLVKFYIQSLGNFQADNDIGSPVFKIFSPNSFQFNIDEFQSSVQTLKVHIEVIQL